MATAAAPVLLILGAGSNVGQHVARAFANKGYKIALVSRSLKEEDSTPDQLQVKADLSDPSAIVQTFAKVEASLGLPSVIVYNAAAATKVDAEDPLGAYKLEDFKKDQNINTTSAFVAAQQAVLAFEKLPNSASRTFIYTGNVLNTMIMPPLLGLGIGKASAAHIMEVAAKSYQTRGFKFYYADERNADGSPAYFAIDGEAHGKHYLELAETPSQGPWQQTFVKNVGYKKF